MRVLFAGDVISGRLILEEIKNLGVLAAIAIADRDRKNLPPIGMPIIDINKINDSIKNIGVEVNLENKKMDECLKNEKYQDEILELIKFEVPVNKVVSFSQKFSAVKKASGISSKTSTNTES